MPTSASLPAGAQIRLLRVDDATALADAYWRNRVHLAPWEPTRADDYFTPAGQQAVIYSQLNQHASGTAHPLVVTLGAAIIARVNLSGIVRGAFQSTSLGYWVDAAHTGRGIATAAVRHAVAVAGDELGLHRVEAGTLLHNAASQRVLLNAGFEQFGLAPRYLKIAGEWQDHLLFQRILHD
ncbi:MAG: GNAT family N-acetyltransferase [Microterricola sp.]